MRQIHNLIQGSPEWHAHRNTPGIFNGSELASIMGLSSYITRSELLRQKATGVVPEVDAATQRRFDDGHKNEALARPLAEEIIGDDLSAMVMTDTIDGVLLSVSLDGITQGYDTTFEHKSLNITLADALDAGMLPDEYHPQCEAGLMVSGAKRCLFMASKDGDMKTARSYWYESKPELRPRIIAACKQFYEDLANYKHVETAIPVVAAPVESLPALAVTVTGSISLVHNLERFGQRLTTFVSGLNSKPETDQDFADLDAAVKVLKEAEGALDSAERNALAQTTTISDMCNLVAMYRKIARDNRLLFEKIVKQEKVNRKAAIISQASTALAAHIIGLNNRLGASYMPAMSGGFSEAIAGLKSLDSMRDKVSTALANAKIAANEIADRIEENRKSLEAGNAMGEDYLFLFPDFAAVCAKARDDFEALVTSRLVAHRQREEAEREKIRKEEADKLAKQNAPQGSVAAVQSVAVAPEAPALSQEPTGEASMPGGSGATGMKGIVPTDLTAQPVSPITDESIIDDFIRLLSIGIVEKKALRPHLLAWEKYRIAREMAVAA